MYNHQLDTFIRVAELKSFSKAAEALYITPSAVIQQVNALENSLDVTLFIRSRRGVTLTKEGQYLYDEGRALIGRCNELRRRLSEMSKSSSRVLRVAVDIYHQPQRLYEIWPEFLKRYPDYTLDTRFFVGGDTTLLRDVDLVEGVYFRENWQQDFKFVPSHVIPLYIGLPGNMPESAKNLLTIGDLASIPVVTIPRGVSNVADQARQYLEDHGIKTITVQQYDSTAVALCLSQQYAMLCPSCWQNLHPSMRLLPVDWSYQLQYGFFEARQVTPSAKVFFDFLSVSSV